MFIEVMQAYCKFALAAIISTVNSKKMNLTGFHSDGDSIGMLNKWRQINDNLSLTEKYQNAPFFYDLL